MKTLIGIPTLNGPDRLRRLLESIFSFTDLRDVKVVVVDDGSTDDNLKLNKDIVHIANGRYPVEMVMHNARRGIAAGWNTLVRHGGDAEIVTLVNDDIEVVEDWLDVLVFSLLHNPKLGMLGLNTYCGVTCAQAPLAPRLDYHEARLLDGGGALVSSHGPIFAFRRAAYDEVEGFDERYFCFYEEVDFGVKLRKRGYWHAMASYPICYHMGGATNSDPRNLNAARCMAESKVKFETKWSASIRTLREQFLSEKCPPPTKREWNSQMKNWAD